MSTKSNTSNSDSSARAKDVNAHLQDSNVCAKNTNVRMQGVTARAQDSNFCVQDPNGHFKKASCNKPTWDQINQQLNRKAFKKGCPPGVECPDEQSGIEFTRSEGNGS